MKIASFELRNKEQVTGEFRICSLKQHQNFKGTPYLVFNLADISGELPAVAWNDRIAGAECLKELDCITVEGRLRNVNGGWLVDVTNVKLLNDAPEHPGNLIPRGMTPDPFIVQQLDNVYDYISHQALKQFVGWVLADASIVFPFISLPASKNHHHSNVGGLLDHSLECVSMVSRFYEFPEDEVQLAMVAALFHDVGKTKTLQGVGKLTSAGYALDHDALTLEVLSQHLKRLDAICPDAGIALRYLWTWRNHQPGYRPPLLTIAEAIASADRISSGLNRQTEAFTNRPAWQTFAKIGDSSSFWRPKMELIKSNAAQTNLQATN